MIPKCLTLTQPWATLVTLNEKRFETRGWNTDYRGPLLVHAAKTFPNWAIKICFREPFRTALVIAGVEDLNDLPLGCIVARSSIEDVVPTKGCRANISDREAEFGDYSPGRYAFKLGIAEATVHIPCSGSLSLWDPPREIWQPLGICEQRPPLFPGDWT